MALNKQIKLYRTKCGMSQEKVAELMGVSRQAVTKWESGASSPSTENLFKLAEIFGITVDALIGTVSEESTLAAEQVYRLFRENEEMKLREKRKRFRQSIIMALIIAVAYLLIYLLGRIIWCSPPDVSIIGLLLSEAPSGENSYLYGWLLQSNLFWISASISVLPSLFGKYRFSVITLTAFSIGLVAGIIFGPNPDGAFYGNTHYGWAIWGAVYLISIAAGIAAEIYFAKKADKDGGINRTSSRF